MRVLPVGQIVSCHPHVADFRKMHGVLFILQVVVSMIVGMLKTWRLRGMADARQDLEG
jgi:hypothetical protein